MPVDIPVSEVYRFEAEQPVNKAKSISTKSKEKKLRNFKSEIELMCLKRIVGNETNIT